MKFLRPRLWIVDCYVISIYIERDYREELCFSLVLIRNFGGNSTRSFVAKAKMDWSFEVSFLLNTMVLRSDPWTCDEINSIPRVFTNTGGTWKGEFFFFFFFLSSMRKEGQLTRLAVTRTNHFFFLPYYS